MKKLSVILIMMATIAAFPQAKTKSAAKVSAENGIFARMETSKGTIVLRLEAEKTPITVANFISLAEGKNPAVADQYKGKPFFNGLKFHRVIADFMIQGGDPLGTGTGDPGYKFKDEISDAVFDRAGILAMANAGPATNGSQFFITHKETPWLNGRHTIFGYVTQGQDVVNSIQQNDLINSVTIVRNGAAAKAFDAVKVFNDYYKDKAEDDKKQAALAEEKRRQQQEAEAAAKKEYEEKYGPAMQAKMAYHQQERKTATKTASGLEYKIIKKGSGKKPAAGTQVFVHYAGFLENGSLFDSSYAEVNQTFGKFDERRGAAGYQPFPFTAGKKDGLIAGFIESLEQMSVGDKLIAWIPANLGYGARGAGNVIPPNTNLIFEIELLDQMPKQ